MARLRTIDQSTLSPSLYRFSVHRADHIKHTVGCKYCANPPKPRSAQKRHAKKGGAVS